MSLHDDATPLERLKQLRQALFDHLFHLVVLVVLLLSAVLLLSTVLLLPTMILLPTMLLLTTVILLSSMLLLLPVPRISAIRWRLWRRRHSMHGTALQIDKDPPLILLGRILQPQLATHLLHAGLNLLHMTATMISLANDDVQMRLAPTPRRANSLLQDVLGLLDVEPVQVHRVRGDAALGVVLTEDIVARLVVVLVHLSGVLLAFLGELVGARAVARLVGLVRAVEA